DVGDIDELGADGGELSLILKLIGDNARDGRANRGVTQLRVERGQMLLRSRNFRSGQGAIVWIERTRAQGDGLFGKTKFIFGGGKFQLRSFEIFLRDAAVREESATPFISCARVGDLGARIA